MYAVSNLNYDLVRELINNGANINITDENGYLTGRIPNKTIRYKS